MATRVIFGGGQFRINVNNGGGNGVDGDQIQPRAATLSDGTIAVVYQSDLFGDATNTESIARVIGNGNYLDVYNFVGTQNEPVVAGKPGGGFGVVFTNARHADATADANGPNITYVPVTVGLATGTPLEVADFNGGAGHDALSNPAIATFGSGRQVVVFERANSVADHDIFLNVVDATGTGVEFASAAPLTILGNASWQANPAVAAFGNRALVVFEDATGTITASANIAARLFDDDFNTINSAIPVIADHAEQLVTPAVAALADNRYIIVYTDTHDVWGRIYDPSTPGGAFLSDEFEIDTPGGLAARPTVAATIDGGFIVAWANVPGAGTYDVRARRFDAHGQAFGDEFTVNSLADNDQYYPTIAIFGSSGLFAWTDYASRPGDTDPTSVQAQSFTTTVFDYDSAGIGDFDGNGRADILFQNDTGNVAVWQTNGAGAVSAISSLGPRPAGYVIDGTGNFNATVGDDILLRSSGGSLAVWPTSGIAVGAPVVIGSTSASYHNAGIGDFTGDGQDDLLFRNDAGDIVTWAIANNALAQAPHVLGSTSLAYHIVGIDDFTGDHQSDILFRNDDGSIAVWQIANNALVSATIVGSTSTAYHVVSTGDFDGNGAKDILFRSDSGELVEWLLDATGALLMAPTSIGTVAAQYHVDGTGDLNGDLRDDIIFRDANGTVVEWLMNGTSLAAPPAAMGTVAVDYAIAAHHFDVV